MKEGLVITPDVMPEDIDEEAFSFLFDKAQDARYVVRRHKFRHGPVVYCGFGKHPIELPGNGKCFIALILERRTRKDRREYEVPVRVAVFRSQRKARETALLWFFQLKGLAVTHLIPGQIPRHERQKRMAQVNGSRCSIRLTGPAGVFIASQVEAENETLPTAAEVEDTNLSTPESDRRPASSLIPQRIGVPDDAVTPEEEPRPLGNSPFSAHVPETVSGMAHTAMTYLKRLIQRQADDGDGPTVYSSSGQSK